jgi:hypothetical protein
MFQQLTNIVFTKLALECPILSGNMQHHIVNESFGTKEATISISGPSYDIAKWRRTGQIVHDGKYDYAISVNNVGAFNGKSKKSQHWVNKSLATSCEIIGKLYNAEVIVDVEL